MLIMCSTMQSLVAELLMAASAWAGLVILTVGAKSLARFDEDTTHQHLLPS